MPIEFNTIDDFDFEGKTVLVRVDINAPIDPNSGVILDDTRMKMYCETLKELSQKKAKVVVLAHQGRPGKKDFTTLEQHRKILSDNLGIEVKYIDSIFSHEAKKAIKSLKNHELLLLENVRFFSEESIIKPAYEQSKTFLPQNLVPLVDIFVNDAFSSAHRSQPSLIGFPPIVPSAAGRKMEEELNIIQNALDNAEKPCVAVFGGVKADDSINAMKNVLKNGTVDHVLTTGLIANIILLASGINIREVNKKFIKDKNYSYLVKKSKKLLKKFGSKIVYPNDVAIENKNKERENVPIDNIPNFPIFDIGIESIKIYTKLIRSAKTIFANGPSGVFEDSKFSMGTEYLINAIANSDGFSIIGGGHIAAVTTALSLENDVGHVSSGGGAFINLLSGKELVAVEALKESAKNMEKNKKYTKVH